MKMEDDIQSLEDRSHETGNDIHKLTDDIYKTEDAIHISEADVLKRGR